MGKLKKFDIEFSNAESAYFAGQEISGKVVIELCEPKKVNEILLELKGRAKTYWTKHSGKSRKHYSQAEPYFCEQFNTYYTHQFTQTTFGNKKERILPDGRHEIPFSYTLPKTLPSSFEGEYGFIRYTCKATCERPWDVDIVAKRAFTVVGIEDINQDPEAMEPACVSECNTSVRLCCRRGGSISVKLSVDRTAFTPGEKLVINALITNDSVKTIRCSTLILRQQVDYRAKTFAGNEQVKHANKIIAKKEKGEITSHSQFAWTNEAVMVPSIPPRLSRCKIIQVTYTLELDADGCVKTSLPIHIGTIPYLSNIIEKTMNSNAGKRDVSSTKNGFTRTDPCSKPSSNTTIVQIKVTNENGQTLDSATESDDLSPQTEVMLFSKKRVRVPSSILSELYPKLPSPYYKESHFGEVDISEDKEDVQYGDTKFAPKYPFYSE